MSVKDFYPVPDEFAKDCHLSKGAYQELYSRSIEDPDEFWAEQAEKFISWSAPWQAVRQGDFNDLKLEWYTDGKLNVCYNCVDRHLDDKADEVAILWEGDEPDDVKKITYQMLYEDVCRFANVLKAKGVKRGDRVCIYLPMIPEVAVAMLACVRIGAIHSVVFAGYSPDALKVRIHDAKARILITANESKRGGKVIPLKQNVDKALQSDDQVQTVLVVKRTDTNVNWVSGRDCWLHEELVDVLPDCPIEVMDANDPLFILYTSGSTGKPKGVLHSTGGYIVYAAATFHYVFDYHPGEMYWCTADAGWITGHSYVVYGPLANGATTLMFEGAPNYPDFARFWEIIDRHRVNIFYTAPTAIRALRREGSQWIEKSCLDSLRLLGSVGEPINPDVWEWFYRVIGQQKCPIVDTWWQTETGGIVLTPFPGATVMKPGAASWPFPGIVADIVDVDGQSVNQGKQGRLVLKQPWPGMMKTIYGDHQRFVEAYFKEVPGCYLTGDSAKQDEDGYFRIIGRDDDVIKVSGHRIGTGELESAFLQHPSVSEAAVVAVPHDIKGSGIYAYIVTKEGVSPDESLKQELVKQIRQTIGAIATPEVVLWVKDLPKTRSGKIMRRILRKIASGETDNLGDLSTLADASVVDELIEKKG